jgi:TRAP-type C4-dicarboxylate transport system permease small subunit
VSAAAANGRAAVRSEGLVHVPGPLLPLANAALTTACYVLDSPAAWTEAVALLLLKITLMLAAAVGVRQETHFRFALAAEAAGRWRGVIEAFGRLATAAIGIVLAGWGASLMVATWGLKAPGAPLPVGLNFAPFVVGGALIAAFAIERLRSGRES